MPTIAELIRARAADDHPAILFEDRSGSYAEYVTACAERAALLEELRRPGPFHVGVLLDNVPEFAMWLGAAAVAGAVVVGINPTRRGAELARDITHTECQLLVTEERHAPLLDGVDTGVGPDRTFDLESAASPDARKFGVTFFNYVGKPLSYILATPERPDDADNSLRLVFGNEGADLDIDRFSRRFGVPVIDSYGSTEGGAVVQRTPDMPPGALGRGDGGMAVLHSGTGEASPAARSDAD